MQSPAIDDKEPVVKIQHFFDEFDEFDEQTGTSR